MPIFDHFDLLAPLYDRLFAVDQATQLVHYLELTGAVRLLDAGGGTGRLSQILRGQVSEIVVADLSFSMLRQAVAGKGLNATCTQTECLPFKEASFDRIIMVDALHHVIDHQSTANELWRVLKPGGILVIEDLDIRQARVKWLALAEKLLLMRSHFIAPAKIAALFQPALARIEIYTSGYTVWVKVSKL